MRRDGTIPIGFFWPAGEYTLVLDPVGPATGSLTLVTLLFVR